MMYESLSDLGQYKTYGIYFHHIILTKSYGENTGGLSYKAR
jgi:hypothetical protein